MKRFIISLAAGALMFLIGIAVVKFFLAKRAGGEAPQTQQQSTAKPDEKRLDFIKIFSGFSFIGSTGAQEAIPVHDLKASLPFPGTFEAGRKYFFHDADATAHDPLLSLQLLQTRFREQGAEASVSREVTGSSPRPAALGFTGQGYEGVVLVATHEPLTKNGSAKSTAKAFDYVLVIEKAPR